MDYAKYIKIQESRSPDGPNREISPWVPAIYEKFFELFKSPILDIGAGNGSSMQYFRNKGLFSMGLDISSIATKVAITDGFPVISFDIDKEGLPLPDKSFKTVTMFHTFEHVLDPIQTLKNIDRVLDGYLIVIVPFERDIDENMGHYNIIHDMEEYKSNFKNFEIVESIQDYFQGHLIIAKNG